VYVFSCKNFFTRKCEISCEKIVSVK